MPKLEVRLLKRMVWSIMSNAALRSKERRVASPLSAAWEIESRR